MENKNSPLFGKNSKTKIPTDHPSPTSSESTQDEDIRTSSPSSACSSSLTDGKHSSKHSKLSKSALMTHSDKLSSKSNINSSPKKILRTEEEKKEIQKQRNRISAQNHRERQKKAFLKLQKKSQEDGKRLKQLEDENKTLRNQIGYLSHQIDSERMRASQLTSIISQNNPSLLELAPSSSLPVSTRVDCPQDFMIDPFNIWLTKPNTTPFDATLNAYDTSSSFYNDLSAFSQYSCEFQQQPSQPKFAPSPNYFYPYYNKSQFQKKPVTFFSWIAALLLGLLILQCFILPSNWISPNPTFSNSFYSPNFNSDSEQLFNVNNSLIEDKTRLSFVMPSSSNLINENLCNNVDFNEAKTEYGDSNSEADYTFKEIIELSEFIEDASDTESTTFDIIYLDTMSDDFSEFDEFFTIDQRYNSYENLSNNYDSISLQNAFEEILSEDEHIHIYDRMENDEFISQSYNLHQYLRTSLKMLPHLTDDFIDTEGNFLFFRFNESKSMQSLCEWPLIQYFYYVVTLSSLLSIFIPTYCKFVTK